MAYKLAMLTVGVNADSQAEMTRFHCEAIFRPRFALRQIARYLMGLRAHLPLYEPAPSALFTRPYRNIALASSKRSPT